MLHGAHAGATGDMQPQHMRMICSWLVDVWTDEAGPLLSQKGLTNEVQSCCQSLLQHSCHAHHCVIRGLGHRSLILMCSQTSVHQYL